MSPELRFLLKRLLPVYPFIAALLGFRVYLGVQNGNLAVEVGSSVVTLLMLGGILVGISRLMKAR